MLPTTLLIQLPRDDSPLRPPPVKVAGRTRTFLIELLHEHERDDALPTSGRFLFYELVARSVISKERHGSRRPDQDMTDALTQLRENDSIRWDWIVDETRTLENYSGATSIKQAVLDYLPDARLDHGEAKPCWY
jgi:hypothetical protein